MTGITWETFQSTEDKPKENTQESDRTLVDFLFDLRMRWNYPCDYPLVVGHKGGREDEKLFRLNQEYHGLNVRALDLGKINGFPTFDRIVSHLKRDKKGNIRIRIHHLTTRRTCKILFKRIIAEFITVQVFAKRGSSMHIGTRTTKSSVGVKRRRIGTLPLSRRIRHGSSIARRLRLPSFGDG